MYYTGIDPFTKQEVYIARHLKDRKMQRALMQFFKPENWVTVRQALANTAKGEKPGERSLPNKGYRPGRRTARRQDKKRKRRGGGSDPRP